MFHTPPFPSRREADLWLRRQRVVGTLMAIALESAETKLRHGYWDAEDGADAWKGVTMESWEDGSRALSAVIRSLNARLLSIQEQTGTCEKDYGLGR